MILKYILCALFAYLLGSISNAVLLSKLVFHQDIREAGSKNAGATNMARVFGIGPGLAILGLDIGKTFLSVWIGSSLCGSVGVCLACVFCNIGHCWPVFFQFRGGKGVSVGAAVAFCCGPKVFVGAVVLFFLLFLFTGIVSVCSMSAAVVMPLLALIYHLPTPVFLSTLSVAVIVVFQHRSNIRRLLNGTESRFSPKKKEK